MKIQFIGHSTFLVTLCDGRRLIIDPYQGMTFQGRFHYPPFQTRVDFALITHEHIDHNYLGDLCEIPVVVRNGWKDCGLEIDSVFAWHDKFGGTKFGGGVLMKIIEAEGLRICHMGDCGEILSDEVIRRLGRIDILMIPVGGFYTMDGDEAAELAQRIGAKTTIPCHYRTRLCSLPIEGPERFLSHFSEVTMYDSDLLDTDAMPSGVLKMRMKFEE